MQNRLKAVGLRPISALVDITNYVSLDLARPLHVYDADLLKGGINVRDAKTGEEFDALNDKSYTAEDGMCAITDDSGLIGLGGVVGGVSTGCTEDTKNVFIESAYFNPNSTAKTGRALQVDSDARYRFDRGVDPEFTVDGIEIATKLVMKLCGGEPMDVVKSGDVPDWKREIDFDPSYTKKLSGMDVPEAQQKEILENLGFTFSGNKVTPPSWRSDVASDGSNGKADLVEEVIRVIGYDHIEAVPVRSANAISDSAETPNITRSRMARSALATRGLSECVTWSFMPKELAGHFGSNDNSLTLSNKNILAQFGEIHPAILDDMDIKAGVVGFEVFLDNLPTPKKKGPAKSLLQLSQFQPVSRDFAFIVDENVEVEQITRAAIGAERNLIASVEVFDVYQGKGVEEGKKSIAINVMIQPVKQTLTDPEIEGIAQKIVDAVSAKTGAVLRG